MKYLVLLWVILSMSSCLLDNWVDCEHGRGDTISEEFDLRDFSTVKLHIDATVYIRQGDDERASISGQANIIDHVDFKVRSDVLTIRTDRCIRNYEPIEIFLTVSDLKQIRVTGSGAVLGEGDWELDDVDLSVTGSGEIFLLLDADDISARISGSGDIQLEGSSNRLDLMITGSGEYYGYEMMTNKAKVTVSGSGSARVYVEDQLDVRITGSGDVYYRGDPVIQSRITGSGQVIDDN